MRSEFTRSLTLRRPAGPSRRARRATAPLGKTSVETALFRLAEDPDRHGRGGRVAARERRHGGRTAVLAGRPRAEFRRCPVRPPRHSRGGEPGLRPAGRSEEHTSELQSLMRISYAVFCLKKKKN